MKRLVILAGLGLFSLDAPADDLAHERAEVRAELFEARDAARSWHWTWSGLFGASVVAQGVLIGVDRDHRAAQAVGAIPPAVGLALQLALPLDALALDEDLREIDAMRPDPETRLAAERALAVRYAASEAEQRGWLAHVAPVVLNAAVAGVLWFGLDEPVQGAIQLGAGLALSELKIWTAPTALSRPNAPAQDLRIAPVVSAGHLGLRGSW